MKRAGQDSNHSFSLPVFTDPIMTPTDAREVPTCRDAQIDEKKYMMREEEEAERSSDLAMELDRQRAVAAYEVSSASSNVRRFHGGLFICMSLWKLLNVVCNPLSCRYVE